MAQIFISYRREDSGGHTGRLRDHLRARFDDAVFHDVDGIQGGQIVESVLEQAIDSCQVALVIIGRPWLTCTDEHGRRRLDDPVDWVRIEVRTLLNRNVVVIPVMVGAATMPRAADLPDDLRALVKRQGHELRDSSWTADVEALVIRLREIIGPTSRDRSPLARVLGRKYLSVAIAGLTALLLLAGGAWI